MLSAYADEAARLTLQGYDTERILALTRWVLDRAGRLRLDCVKPAGGLVDDGQALAEREAQVRASGAPGRC